MPCFVSWVEAMDFLMDVTKILWNVRKRLPNDTTPLPIRLESFAEEFLAFCGIWHYLLFSQNVPYSVTSNYLLRSVDDASGSRSGTPRKFWNVVLEKDRKDQLDRTCEKWRSITFSQGAEEYPAWNK